jgi:hypothetical protein
MAFSALDILEEFADAQSLASGVRGTMVQTGLYEAPLRQPQASIAAAYRLRTKAKGLCLACGRRRAARLTSIYAGPRWGERGVYCVACREKANARNRAARARAKRAA